MLLRPKRHVVSAVTTMALSPGHDVNLIRYEIRLGDGSGWQFRFVLCNEISHTCCHRISIVHFASHLDYPSDRPVA